jgi:hypothetical protein
MAGLVPAIHVFEAERLLIKTWMPGTGPGMTSFFDAEGLATVVIARSEATKQSSFLRCRTMDCFASLAVTGSGRARHTLNGRRPA